MKPGIRRLPLVPFIKIYKFSSFENAATHLPFLVYLLLTRYMKLLTVCVGRKKLSDFLATKQKLKLVLHHKLPQCGLNNLQNLNFFAWQMSQISCVHLKQIAAMDPEDRKWDAAHSTSPKFGDNIVGALLNLHISRSLVHKIN